MTMPGLFSLKVQRVVGSTSVGDTTHGRNTDVKPLTSIAVMNEITPDCANEEDKLKLFF